jgi:hypothetical protein
VSFAVNDVKEDLIDPAVHGHVHQVWGRDMG